MPFWRTVGASTDTAAYANAMGSGLERTKEGMLRITDPTEAWLEVQADGTSDYARIDPSFVTGKALTAVHIRVSVDHRSLSATSFSPQSPRSCYVHAPGSGTLRMSIEEPKGSLIPIQAVRANVKVPFDFNPARVAIMAAILLAVACWRPGSWLWRIPLDTASTAQRTLGLCLAAPIVFAMVYGIVTQLAGEPLVFHEAGGYTYDFDQYGHIADALLQGRTSLDLNVPDALAAAANPYNTDVRARLLAEGVNPIYWDYAYYNGHWYSYFGVLPAVLLFMPYRLLTGHMLSSGAAVLLLMLLAILFLALLVIRVIARIAPKTSLAATSIALTTMLLGSNAGYLLFRRNFYSVPFAASLALSALGIWLWLGAECKNANDNAETGRRGIRGRCTAISRRQPVAGGGCFRALVDQGRLRLAVHRGEFRLSPHLLPDGTAGHRHILAAAEGHRPRTAERSGTQSDDAACSNRGHHRGTHPRPAAHGLQCGAIRLATEFRQQLPAHRHRYDGIPCFPGEHHADNRQLSAAAIALHRSFPWIALSAAAMPEWSYMEPMIGGLFAMCPVAALAFALPFLHSQDGRPGRTRTTLTALALAFVLVVFDAMNAGLGWRYMADFGWLFVLASLPVLLRLLGEPGMIDGNGASHASNPPVGIRAARLVIALATLFAIAVAVLSLFTIGRHDALVSTAPNLFYNVFAWFL